MTVFIDPSEERYILGLPAMDETHQEFIQLVNQIATEVDKVRFAQLFEQLVQHTEAHFAAENILMDETLFPAISEHKGEHLRVLGDLHRLSKRVAKGNLMMARAYVREQIPDWFDLHASSMDSALAAHIKARLD